MERTIFTVGHSTHSQERLAELLRLHRISAVSDVRSQPYSRINPQFNREDLKDFLNKHGIAYSFLGKELGARSPDPTCYEGGQVQYGRLAKTHLFQQGIKRIEEGSQKYLIALMCAEKEPLDCHRTILVSRHLFDAGWTVKHVHADGRLEDHSDAINRLIQKLGIPKMFLSSAELRAEAYRRQSELIAYNIPTVESSDTEMYGGTWR